MSSVAAPALVTGGARVSRDSADGTSALAALVERAREGDGRAFDRLMLETQERVMGLAWRLLGGREDARDAAQEVYLRVFRHLGRFRAGHDFHGWLYRITVNVCRDAARRRRRTPVVDGHAEGLSGAPLELLSPHPIGRLAFDGVRVDPVDVLGEVDRGFGVAMRTLDLFRPSVGGFGTRSIGLCLRNFAEAYAAFRVPTAMVAPRRLLRRR